MKNIFSLFLASILLLSVFSCKEDDSLAISQDQLLRSGKWQLKEIRKTKGNITETDKLLSCERQSTLDFSDVTNYNSNMYKTEKGNCVQEQTTGTYVYNTSKTKRLLTMSLNDTTYNYYVKQLDPKYLILQDTLSKVDTIKLRLQVFEIVK
ncbi:MULTISPECIES: lipocalin family protein [Empedobacter]|mgnify:CR=1 FL=1|uniref:lipocalin family protein n=1 Tax=Empedobacter TaxID=59734 RepID=UPI001C5A0F9F|nr:MULTISPECIES: lipocalin family protein [Empedobacter]MBW1618186.1 lipocalin family protein [Empedobacter falsenii]MDH0658630.1 lipocalin family protein [Empedobacter sp. GD03865]MDH0675429.1 lipocalin family protein [Empedobacter sp. GD03861]MDH1603743.1 lipocalin family protein [Empedobacter sp. GD03739]